MQARYHLNARWAAVLLAAVGGAWLARGQVPDNEMPPIVKKVGFDQRLGAQLPLDLSFVDETGTPVKLGDYFGDRPVVLVLAYYECPMLCTLVLNGLVATLRDLPFTPGEDIELVTVSFDPGETPSLAAAKKKTYVDLYHHKGAETGWHFLTGSESSIEALTSAVGFAYAYDEKADQYAHASGIMIVTPEGRLSHYFFGVQYPTQDVRLSLVEASDNRIGSPVDRLLLFCYHYDPVAGRYSVSILNVVRAGCLATVVILGGFMAIMLRRDARARTRERHRTSPRATS